MQPDLIKSYLNLFNAYSYKTDEVEFWFARNLQKLLGYNDWRNFRSVIEKAKIACGKVGIEISDHFADSTRTVEMPNGGTKEIDDIILSRYACYLVAQNSDSTKDPVAFAMNYFAVQTRKQEVLEKRIEEWERLQARDKLSLSEKTMSGLLYERGVDNKGFALIRNKRRPCFIRRLFDQRNESETWGTAETGLADFLPTITIKAKDFANEITIFNVKKDSQLSGVEPIANEHEKNNRDVRDVLLKRGIKPEALPAEEDLHKLKRRVESDDKKMVKQMKKLKDK